MTIYDTYEGKSCDFVGPKYDDGVESCEVQGPLEKMYEKNA